MTIIGRHPFWFLFGAAGLVLLVIILATRGQSVPANSFIVSVGGGQLEAPGISSAQTPIVSEAAPSDATPASIYVPIVFTTTQNGATSAPAETAQSTDATTTTAANETSPSQSSDSLLQEAYSLIPSSFAPTQTIQPSAPKTPEQQALYTYGNEAGLAILTLYNTETNTTQVLKNWLVDATSTAQIAQVDAIAQTLIRTSTQLANLPDVPASAEADNAALAQSLDTAGNDLKRVATSGGSDTTLVSAMKTYDNDASTFTTDFLALSDLFSLSQVTFSASDPGSVFQFSSASSL